MQELANRTMTHIIAPTGKHEVSGGFDVCREYEYEEEDEEDEGDQISSPRHVPIDSLHVSLGSNLEDESSSLSTFVLGKSYHPIHDYAPRRDDESSLFWFTYRCDFPEIAPYRITTDAGWGCMLRSAQMLLGQALRMHFQTRDWQPPASLAKRRLDPFIRRVLTWFADFPSQSENVFSLHNMVAAGIAQYQVLPGEWWGPGTVSHVICDLCALYEEQQRQKLQQHDAGFRRTFAPGDLNRPMFRVHVASQGTVYRDSLELLMTTGTKGTKEARDIEAAIVPQDHPLWHPLDHQYAPEQTAKPKEWDTGLLLLIPLRLGLKNFNEDYSMALASIFSSRQSVGVLGGRPRGARWFYGANSDGSNLYGLDPHTVQTAPHRQMVMTNVGKRVRIVAFTDDYLRSVHTKYPEAIPMSRMDPSMALGFYCRDRNDFEHLCASLQKWKEEHTDMPELFAVEDAVPDYCANVSSAMHEMLAGDEFADSFAEDALENDEASDEDEYVML
jgi:cysteine protease ATG4